VLGGKQGDQDIYGGRADIFSVDVLKEKAREIDMLESKTQKSNSVLRRSPSSMDLRRQPSKRGSYLTGEEEDYIQTRTPSLSQFEIKRINGLITCLDLSPNADRLLVGGKDRHAAVYVLPRVTDGELWKSKWRNKAKGTPYYEVEADATIDDVAFSGDSCRFAVAHSKRVDVHDAAKGSFLFMVETDRQIYHIECSRDGRQLAIGTRWDRRALQIWDMHSGQHKLFEHQMRKGCRHLAFSPCGTFIAVANKSQVERVCPQTGSVKLQKVVHEQEGVSSVAASPCGNVRNVFKF
jgi:WD40 repeat protein